MVGEGLRSPQPPPPLARRGARGEICYSLFPGMIYSHTLVLQSNAPSYKAPATTILTGRLSQQPPYEVHIEPDTMGTGLSLSLPQPVAHPAPL